jgi:MFS family permease
MGEQLDRAAPKARDRGTLLGMTRGAAVMFGFGIAWLLIGLLGGRFSPALLWLSLLFVGIALVASIAALGLRASRLPFDATPPSVQQVATDRKIRRRFSLVFGIEMAAITLAVNVLYAIHYPDYISCVIALIVGVHFFALVPLFKAPVYYVTGLLGCAISLVGFYVADAVLRQAVVGLSFGLLLWATAAWVAWIGLSAARRVLRNLPPTGR